MSPKSILSTTIANLRTLGNDSVATFVEAQREDILREIGIARSTEGEGTRSGISFGSVSLAKLSKRLAPKETAGAKEFKREWAQFTAQWAYVVALNA
jgi:hypothetical protein